MPRLSLPEISCHSTSREIPVPIMLEYSCSVHSERHLNFWYHLEHALWLSHVSLIFSRLELRRLPRRIALGRIKRQNQRLADFVSLKSALEKWPVWVFL